MITFTKKSACTHTLAIVLASNFGHLAIGAPANAATSASTAIATSFSPDVSAKAMTLASSNPIVLGSFDAESDEEMTVATIRLAARPAWDKVTLEEHGSFLQIVLPQTIVPHPGEFIDGKGPYFKKLASYQLSPTDGAIRIFVEGDSAQIMAAATAELLNDRVVLTLDHRSISKKAGPASPATESAVVTSEGAPSGSLSPADLAKSAPSYLAGTGVTDLSSRLNAVAIFSAVMLIGLILFATIRGLWKRKKFRDGLGEPYDMRSLATYALGPKQRLNLIEVCNEKILVGVSPAGINYITTLTPAPTRRSLHNPNHEPSVGLPPQIQPYFQKNNSPTQTPVELKASPVITQSSTESEPSRPRKQTTRSTEVESTPMPTQRKGAVKNQEPRSRINVAITDEGVVNGGSKRSAPHEEPQDINDVTRLIREKLKNMSNLAQRSE